MKAFGFPPSISNGALLSRTGTYRVAQELIDTMATSERLWKEEGKQEESMIIDDV
jgi:molybdopterin synthase catalytic subunit